MSVGIEHVDDLRADLLVGLDRAARAGDAVAKVAT